ncbi:hypothetical protein U0B03_23695, partial [Escherichia coli]|nr:hypothetical protein [Escherichia coli]MDY9336835.1 hypothetical protein [Escherichia coli]
TDDLFVGKTLLHGDVLMWLMKTLLTSGCTNQRGAGHSHVAENIDFRSEPQQHVKKGIRGWSRRADNRRAFSAVIDVAVNYFGFDPIHPESSFRNIDFNRIMSVLHNLGYFVCALR